METIQVPVSGWLGKENVVQNVWQYYSVRRKFWHMYNMDEPSRHCTKSNKPDTKDYMLLFIWSTQSSQIDRKRRIIVTRVCKKETDNVKWVQSFGLEDEKVLEMDSVDRYRTM